MKYYCDHCCTIHQQKGECIRCGNVHLIPIIIDVQHQKSKEK